jgi:hypothetical protein
MEAANKKRLSPLDGFLVYLLVCQKALLFQYTTNADGFLITFWGDVCQYKAIN